MTGLSCVVALSSPLAWLDNCVFYGVHDHRDLHSFPTRRSSDLWLEAAKVTLDDPDRGPRFLDSAHSLHAALDDQGVLLGRSVLVREEVEAGRLVKPFDISIPSDYAYWIICPKADINRPKVRLFRDWLLAEAAALGPQDTPQ